MFVGEFMVSDTANNGKREYSSKNCFVRKKGKLGLKLSSINSISESEAEIKSEESKRYLLGPVEIINIRTKKQAKLGGKICNVKLYRNSNCVNYQNCLSIAATLNWHSFTCDGCSGNLNPELSWKVLREAKNDQVSNYFMKEDKKTLIKKIILR
jgi:hypothetical protein